VAAAGPQPFRMAGITGNLRSRRGYLKQESGKAHHLIVVLEMLPRPQKLKILHGSTSTLSLKSTERINGNFFPTKSDFSFN